MNNYMLMYVALPTLLAIPMVGYPLATEVGRPDTPNSRMIFLDTGQSNALPQVLYRIEQSTNIVVYRVQVATNENSLAVLGQNPQGVKLALAADAGNIAVLYPDLGDPYRAIFAKIIEGIEGQVGASVASFAVGGAVSSQDIVAQLKRQNIKVVIALGRQGVNAAASLEHEIGVIAGGLVSPPEGQGRSFPMVSLAPDPKMLFERLKNFMPEVRRVIVVYDPKQNTWLIRLAREAARNLGLELHAVEVADLKSAVRVYQDIFTTADPKRDALWLPQDATSAEESTVLPLILESAWNQSVTVFSSSVTHVKRGALFSLYPNNVAMGRQLASSAQNLPLGGVPSVVPMKDALLAVNVRTASHLGLQLSPRQKSFDLVFPAP